MRGELRIDSLGGGGEIFIFQLRDKHLQTSYKTHKAQKNEAGRTNCDERSVPEAGVV